MTFCLSGYRHARRSRLKYSGILCQNHDYTQNQDIGVIFQFFTSSMFTIFTSSLVQVGSRILAVDGVSVEGLFLDAVRDKISGECGSQVTIRYDSIDGNQHVVTLIRSWSLTTPSHGRSDSTSICAASNLVLDTTSRQQLPSRSRSRSPFASERAHDAIISKTLFFDLTPNSSWNQMWF